MSSSPSRKTVCRWRPVPAVAVRCGRGDPARGWGWWGAGGGWGARPELRQRWEGADRPRQAERRRARAVAVQTDGKIVVAGCEQEPAAATTSRSSATRPAGSWTRASARGGKVLTDLGASYDVAYAVAVQADGKIVVAGNSAPATATTSRSSGTRASGKLDASFGSGGKVLTDLGSASYDRAYAVAVQKDGKIVVAGRSNARRQLRLRARPLHDRREAGRELRHGRQGDDRPRHQERRRGRRGRGADGREDRRRRRQRRRRQTTSRSSATRAAGRWTRASARAGR